MVEVCNIYLQVCDTLKEISPDYELETLELCSKFLNIGKAVIPFSQAIPSDLEYEALQKSVNYRLNGMPLQYILGEWDFYGEKFYVGEGVLIPRADTETLIDVISTSDYVTNVVANNKEFSVLDICSGSGCIAITLERLYSCIKVTAIEKSDLAFEYLKKNLDLHKSNVYAIMEDALTIDISKLDEFDIIVSNPPYIKPCEVDLLQKEVQFEPRMALEGGEDGLYFYRELTKKYSKILKSNGTIYYEIGIDQENDVRNILLENNLSDIRYYQDLSGIVRVVSASKYDYD